MPYLRRVNDVRFCLCDLQSIQIIKILVCLCSHGLYIYRWGAKFRWVLHFYIQISDRCRWPDIVFCKHLCFSNSKLLLLIGIALVMDLWHEILGERNALLIDSSLCFLTQNQVFQLYRHLNLHTYHAGHVYLEFSYFSWLRQWQFAWLIPLVLWFT